MQVYKSFFKVARQNISGIIMYTAIVVGMIIALSVANSGKKEVSAATKKYVVYVVDKDKTTESSALVDYIGQAHKIYKDKLSEEQILDELYYQHITSYITIPEGFGESVDSDEPKQIVCIYDEAMPNGAFINMQINEVVNAAMDYVKMGKSFDEGMKLARKALDISEFVEIKTEKKAATDVTPMLFTFMPFGIFSIIFSALLPAVVNYNNKEIKDRMSASSLKISVKNIEIICGVGTFSFIVLAMLLVAVSIPQAGKFLFTKMWFMAVLASVVYTFACMTLLSFISNLPFIRQGATSMVTNIIGLSFAFLGGTFVGLDILGDGIKKIGRFVPNYWYSMSIKTIFGPEDYKKSLGYISVIFAFALACLGLSLIVSKINMEKKN